MKSMNPVLTYISLVKMTSCKFKKDNMFNCRCQLIELRLSLEFVIEGTGYNTFIKKLKFI